MGVHGRGLAGTRRDVNCWRKNGRYGAALAALFSLDAFVGGFVLQALLALRLCAQFDLSLAAAGVFFFWSGPAGGGVVPCGRPARRGASTWWTPWCSRTSFGACT
jgi:hypothetical protein